MSKIHIPHSSKTDAKGVACVFKSDGVLTKCQYTMSRSETWLVWFKLHALNLTEL